MDGWMNELFTLTGSFVRSAVPEWFAHACTSVRVLTHTHTLTDTHTQSHTFISAMELCVRIL